MKTTKKIDHDAETMVTSMGLQDEIENTDSAYAEHYRGRTRIASEFTTVSESLEFLIQEASCPEDLAMSIWLWTKLMEFKRERMTRLMDAMKAGGVGGMMKAGGE